MSILTGLKKIAKTASGVQAIQDRKEAKEVKSNAEVKYNRSQESYSKVECEAKDVIQKFGEVRLKSLKNTVGRFLGFLKDLEQKNKEKSYEILDDIQIPQEIINELGSLEMNASTVFAGSATAGVLGSAAAYGVASATPTAVTGAVTAFAHASTGTAISALHGAAHTNAVLAWLGGGSLASGGGGMAAGTATLATITTAATVAATGFVLIATAGTFASLHFSKKLTEAKEYEKSVDIAVEKMKTAEVLLHAIQNRTKELENVTIELEKRAISELDLLEPLIPDFEYDVDYYKKRFQTCGLLVKALGELAKTPLLDNDGNVSLESCEIIQKTHTILNTEL
jgi:hypothetical protein